MIGVERIGDRGSFNCGRCSVEQERTTDDSVLDPLHHVAIFSLEVTLEVTFVSSTMCTRYVYLTSS